MVFCFLLLTIYLQSRVKLVVLSLFSSYCCLSLIELLTCNSWYYVIKGTQSAGAHAH